MLGNITITISEKNKFDSPRRLSRRNTVLVKAYNVYLQNNIKFLNESNFRLTPEVLTLKNKVDEQDKKIQTLMEMFQKIFNIKIDKDKFLKKGNMDRQISFKDETEKKENILKSNNDDSLQDFDKFF